MQTNLSTEFKKKIDLVVRSRETSQEAVSAAIVLIAIRKGSVTTDDVHECLEVDGDNRWLGSVIGALKRRGVLEQTGFVRTKRKEAHGRPISVFGLSEEWHKHWPGEWKNPKSQVMETEDGETLLVVD